MGRRSELQDDDVMGWFSRKKKPEARATAVQSSPDLVRVLGLQDYLAASSGITVTIDKALGVPAVWAAVNFISGTIAGLPLHVYRKSRKGRVKVTTGLAPILHDAVNDEMTSFDWRKYTFERILTGGRAFTYIERDLRGNVMSLWPLTPEAMRVRISGGRREYRYKDGARENVYAASEILDLSFMSKPDGVSHAGPIHTNRDVVALAIAATQYGSKFFANGGVPPFAVTGNFQTGAALQRASDDLAAAVKKAAEEDRLALTMPAGLEIKSIGTEPEKTQLVEVKRFLIEEVARIYSLPPTFLQDLTHGSYSNTEQQDLHFAKHTLKRWIEQAEQEMNLKLFGRGSSSYVEFSIDGLLRGDYKTRMEGHASAIQHGISTPDEVRELENKSPLPDGVGEVGWMQGAMAPMSGLVASQTGEATGDENGL